MTNDYVNHENMIMLIMVSDLIIQCKWSLKTWNLTIILTMLNDYVDYGKWSFRSYQHDCIVLFKR